MAGLLVGQCSSPDVPSPASGDPQDDLVLARVGDREIRVRDLNYKIKVQIPALEGATGLTDVKQKRQVLQQMLEQYCWVNLAERKGYDKDPDFLATLELSRKYILADQCAKREVYDVAQVTPEMARQYYDEHLDQYQADAWCKGRMILSQTRAQAEQIRSALDAGADFETLARARTVDNLTRSSGGFLGTVTRTSDLPGFRDFHEINQAILQLGEGEISQPFQTPKGWAILQAFDRVDARVMRFEDVQSDIKDKLYKKEVNRLFSSTLQQVEQQVGAEILDPAWIGYAVSRLNEDEIFTAAKAEKDPESRILYYRGLLQKYPDSPKCAQARFMIGFIYADQMKDFPKAREAFQDMIDHHPQDELTASAKWMIDNMEKNLEDLPYYAQIKRKIEERDR